MAFSGDAGGGEAVTVKLTIVPDQIIVVDLGEGDAAHGKSAKTTPKPSIHPLTLSGHPITLSSPHDHVHHRGVMFAMKVDGVNYWEEGKVRDLGVKG